MFRRYLLLCFLCGIYIYAQEDFELEVGETCIFDEARNITGVCKLLKDCQFAISVIKNEERHPASCGWQGNSRIVCCPPPDHLGGVFENYFDATTRNVLTNGEMTCRYTGEVPMICCPNKYEPKRNSQLTSKYNVQFPQCKRPVVERPSFHNAEQELAWTKCVEYDEYSRFCKNNEKDPNNPISESLCHIQYDIPKIIVGTNAAPNEFPHMAVLGCAGEKYSEVDIEWVGGGSLISRKYILTAAHVLVSRMFGRLRYAMLGTLDKTDLSNGELFTIVNLIPHKNYVFSEHYHDIALVELNREVVLSEFIRPVCLPVPGITYEPVRIIAGWGSTSTRSGSYTSKVLLKAYVQEMPTDKCAESLVLKGFEWDNATMICAKGKKVSRNSQNQDACQGDSGGPLVSVVTTEGLKCNYVVNGIISWGQGCGHDTPAAYTRVEAYLRWIVERVWPRELRAMEDTRKERDCGPILTNVTAPSIGRKAFNKCLEYQTSLLFPCERGSRGNYCQHDTSMEVTSHDASQDEFPHMAMIGAGNVTGVSFFCAGSVISERFILTVASCESRDLGPPTFVLVGTLKRTTLGNDENENLYKIKRIEHHRNYLPPSRYHDIALLETEKPIKLSPSVVPACLDTGIQADEVLGTGWGATSDKGSLPDTLQKVKLSKFGDRECYEHFPPSQRYPNGIARTQVCFSPTQEGRDMCSGNAGTPVQVKTHSCMYTVVGLLSIGGKCGVVGEPSVYTRVEKYLTWIENIVWPA